jgi:serine phosphatase RsbU (regulator of sigma subunit)
MKFLRPKPNHTAGYSAIPAPKQLGKRQVLIFRTENKAHNLRTMNIFSVVLIVLQIPLILIDILRRQSGQWLETPGYAYLFSLHVAMVVLCLLFIATRLFFLKPRSDTAVTLRYLLSTIFPLLLLLWGASVTGVDQLIHGQITVMLLFSISIAAILHFTLVESLALYLLQYVAFIILATLLQADRDILEGHYINGTVLVVVCFVLNRIVYTSRKNDFINRLTIKSQTDEIEKSRNELRTTNRQLVDGIQYAQVIQLAILPREETLREICSDHFVIWKPREVVGGDFYFMESYGKDYLLGVVDCTGHGVPGAFMAMAVYSSLKHIATSAAAPHPSTIIHELNAEVKRILNRDKSRSLNDDGLDIGLAYVDPCAGELLYSGAKIPLFVASGGEIEVLSPNRQSIGYRDSPDDIVFDEHSIKLADHSTFYMASDGFYHQIGGEKRHPFGLEQLVALLSEVSSETTQEQKRILLEHFDEFRKNEDQRDDVTLVGFRAF